MKQILAERNTPSALEDSQITAQVGLNDIKVKNGSHRVSESFDASRATASRQTRSLIVEGHRDSVRQKQPFDAFNPLNNNVQKADMARRRLKIGSRAGQILDQTFQASDFTALKGISTLRPQTQIGTATIKSSRYAGVRSLATTAGQ